MPLIKNFLMRWIHWPILLSICLHISVAAALFCTMIPEKQPDAALMSVAMIQLAAEEASVSEPAAPEPVSEPEEPPEPEPVPEPVIPKPEVKKLKPEVKKKIVKKQQSEPVERKAEQPEKPLPNQNVLANRTDNNQSDTAIKPQKGPKALSKSLPVYPSRAAALGTEGYVKVKYDIDEDGRVKNIEVIGANPPNVFDREVRKAMRKWRYEKIPAVGYITTVEFKITGITQS
ncbi:transport protein TonB [Photorhabdus australis subsp. thailandensis]|uniref:Protein TonB n=1 Tax=Photorhabdus australis subsp. thailandensis TaxID=2805096 RepID=A0A1C0U819_9GAMM|nr:TonB system transport protein TonB [Photorhabdus australis]OCQ54074.1 transport protein TonB [Photorhabdus australis subsp. thailandensis]